MPGRASGPASPVQEDAAISKEDQTSLIWLQMHWESHYKISFEEGVWQALPLFAPADILTADTAMKLRDTMKDHFAESPTGRRTAR